MDILTTLSKAISTNGIKRATSGSTFSEILLPATFTNHLNVDRLDRSKPMEKNRQEDRSEKSKSRNLQIAENSHLVGKNSSFERKLVQEMLLPYRPTHKFKRQEIKADYDTAKANKLYHLRKQMLQNESWMEREDQLLLNELLPLMVKLANFRVYLPHVNKRRLFQRESMREIPQVPKFDEDPMVFTDYIGLLTHTKFRYKSSSKQNGIIPKMLKMMVNPSNKVTLPYQTSQTYNDVMFFFKQRSDYASMRETFRLMKIANCQLNTATYNIIISAILKNSKIRKVKKVNGELAYYLNDMINRKIGVNYITWNLLGQFLMSQSALEFYIKKMIEQEIPVTQSLALKVFETVFKNENGNKNGRTIVITLLNFLKINRISFDSEILKFTLKHLLEDTKNGNSLEVAWELLNFAYRKNQNMFNVEILNLFLNHVSLSGRIDLSLIILYHFKNVFKVSSNVESFQFLYKSLVRNGYSVNFPVILKFLKNLQLKMKLGYRKNYWLVKCESISKFNCLKQVTSEDLEKLGYLMEHIVNGGMKVKWELFKVSSRDERKLLRYLHCVPYNNNGNSREKTRDKHCITSGETKAKKTEYRKRIRYIAVQNAMIKRIGYANNWKEALTKELKDRKLI
ncbi:hypothetical protein KAFR_0B01690 [Kazachstania africana CBS 2517]|uniref:ATPase expression protein 3 n=1 Tax=Kazachstania africana (strain ATCC 22294 / BCRC 22015 / CBS 2517 / CECT 1963 / NBRC 1671 / NRRL Y-8276) TaxID=1071382 RepID=H2AQ18_KAZAF|nr:hypothetical protein KAFR_0B01690 [Kazachstania africana CBS 2517]CCF56468.1 hypothetical protein KAFR_0B01690 [Kazachstania africana CBS 2517]